MRILNKLLVDATSLSASFNSEAQELDHIYGFSVHAVFTGTPSGTFRLQCSNDDVQLPSQVVNWTNITDSDQIVSAAGDIMYNYREANYKWVRLVYIRVGGTGSVSARVYIKGV